MPQRSLKFRKTQRLTRESEFRQVRQRGRIARGNLFTLGLLQNESAAPVRAGIITSRKLGRAVVRNRVRRRLREIIRRHQYEVAAGTWMVIIARPSAARVSYQRLEEEWLRLAKRASILSA
ncbi:MAG TPA: ribonuclease P protein component [Chthoniobacterales bacterium]|nr:ribonuclease P protein component [Chthoniobacterales bacterium]